MRFNASIDVKDRNRYELNGFRGVDTASTPTEVATKRATYMRNFINRDGVNHKRYGWVADLSGVISPDDKVYMTFSANMSSSVVDFIHYGTTLKAYVYSTTTTYTLTGLAEQKSFAFYSQDIVYIVGVGTIYAFGDFGSGFEFQEVFNNFDITYAPLVLTNINHSAYSGDDTTEVIDDYNLLTNYVRYGLVGADNSSDALIYNFPHRISLSDKSFSVDVTIYNSTTKETETTTYTNIVTGSPTVVSTSSSYTRAGVGEYVYIGGTYYSLSMGHGSSATLSGTTSKTYYASAEKTIAKFSNGYYVKWVDYDDDYYRLVVYDDSDTEIAQAGYVSKTVDHYGGSLGLTKYYAFRLTNIDTDGWTADENGYITVTSCYSYTDYYIAQLYGNFPTVENTGSILYDDNDTAIADVTESYIQFYAETTSGLNIETPISESTNIFVKCWDDEYTPNYDLAEINKAILFGADGACDRIFATIEDEPNLIFWSEYSDNSYYDGKAFTYFADTAYASMGATQNAVTGLQRLNDSTLAVFRERQVNENDFVILTATTSSIDSFEVNGTTYEIPVLKVTCASANMPQTAINNDCFGALGSDVLFASDMGVYAVNISTGTSVERYAIERSDPISNLFKDCTMADAKAIVYKNKYYLAVKYKEDTDYEEDLVLIADARYSYTLDRNMDDTSNYEWYIWNHCPVQKWIIEDNVLGFYDYDGNKCMFTEDNYIDKLYTSHDLAVSHPTLNGSTVTNRYVVSATYADTPLIVSQDVYHILDGVATEISTEYTIKFVADDEHTFDNDITGYRIYYLTNNEWNLVTDSEPIQWAFGSSTAGVGGTVYGVLILDQENVVATWITPSLDLGANDRLKTLFMLTIGLEHTTGGEIQFGYQTKYYPEQIEVATINGQTFDLDDLGFTSLTLGQSFASAVTKKVKLRNFNYIQYIFKSESDGDICVNGITMLYKYNTFNKGVK